MKKKKKNGEVVGKQLGEGRRQRGLLSANIYSNRCERPVLTS